MSDFYKLGVVGQNISYSQSKNIFETIFGLTGVGGSFDILSTEPGDLSARIQDCVDESYTGLSITVPFKSEVVPLMTQTDPLGSRLNVVNCISIENGQLRGHNTDVIGFAIPLEMRQAGSDRRHAVIFGYGGSASVVVYSLASDFGMKQFTIVGRSESKLTAFRDRMTAVLPNIDIHAESSEHFTAGFDDRYAVAVNCTPLGGWNLPGSSPLPKRFDWSAVDIYYDLNYNRDNHLVTAARNAGVTAIDGSTMLVGQALESFHIWSGMTVDFNPVYRAVFGDR